MDRLASLADNVTETRVGVHDANVAISQLDNVSPRETKAMVTALSEIGRAHVRTPVTRGSRMPSSA